MAKITFVKSNSSNVSTPSTGHSSLFIDSADGLLKTRNPDGTITSYGPSSAIEAAYTYTDTKISQLINSAPSVLDTLKELADALGDDPNFATTIASQLSAESTARQSGDSALQTSLNAEILARQAADTGLSGDISAEASARQAADETISGNLSTEVSARQAADTTLQGNIDTEVSARQAADTTLNSAISSEQSARIAADQTLSNSISSEATTRASADTALSGRLDVIEGVGDGSVAKALSDAKSYADQKVTDLVNSAPAVLDTLKELADALGQDPNFATTVAGQIGSEATARQNADTTLQSNISAEQTARELADNALDSRLDVIEGSDTTAGSVAKALKDAKSYADSLVGPVSSDQADLDAYAQDIRSDLDQEILDRQAGDTAAQTYADNLADRFVKDGFTADATMVTNGYATLSFKAAPNSLNVFIDRLALIEGSGFDYTVSVVGGVTRITFTNDFMTSQEAVGVGDRLTVAYYKDVR